jgi:hypothetical protein
MDLESKYKSIAISTIVGTSSHNMKQASPEKLAPYHPYTMPMIKLQHIRVTAFREPLRIYERDTKGIEKASS